MPPTHVAILGGGLTGLSSAFHLSRRFPKARITLLERQPRLGGWVRSERVPVRVPIAAVEGGAGRTEEASVLLEAGPRTLRPNALAVLELVNLLNLTPSLITVPRTAPAARNRFLHIPGTRGLELIPASLPALLASPLGRLLIRAIVKDAVGSTYKAVGTHSTESTDDDESLESFLMRHFGGEFARTLGSALVHGVYAADARELSVKAAFPSLLEMERQGRGSVVRGAIRSAFGSTDSGKKVRSREEDPTLKEYYDVGAVPYLMNGVSVFSFRNGMETMVRALENSFWNKGNVKIVKGDGAARLSKIGDNFEITTASGRVHSVSHLVSSIPLPSLYSLLETSASSLPSTSALSIPPHLTASPSSSVTVVNLIFPVVFSRPLYPPGFGYLIPRPPPPYDYSRGNELGILGTVFDSSSLAEQDRGPAADKVKKVTVILGRPYSASAANLQSPTFIDRLLHQLAVHLAPNQDGEIRPLPKPLFVRIHQHAGCIPAPTVGHERRMEEMRAAVREHWGERAEIVGAGVGGVSVGACVEMGRNVGKEW
ncbi:Protoporphyrinogen oxidase [Laetiporus sulphureus 93-53]|uniref:Protoporphyrinogen oxidase n=1 Tax=Laetiporus sulphureus 93-53 TaxID=1314785 RepID=A0A165B8M1_9APHY|nr:Protoporphyrinogen oxidase [Laetiporus sulphureus 93-53]KZT00496.1 Protoporphyrinogen oxidase [Laetiporus sulphureus 93-53]